MKKFLYCVSCVVLISIICFTFNGCKKSSSSGYISDDFLQFGEWEFSVQNVFENYSHTDGNTYTLVMLYGSGFYKKDSYEFFGNNFTVKTMLKIYHPAFVAFPQEIGVLGDFVSASDSRCSKNGNRGTAYQKYGDTPVYIFSNINVSLLISNEVKKDTFATVYFHNSPVCEFN